jgi:hypothetical protein
VQDRAVAREHIARQLSELSAVSPLEEASFDLLLGLLGEALAEQVDVDLPVAAPRRSGRGAGVALELGRPRQAPRGRSRPAIRAVHCRST